MPLPGELGQLNDVRINVESPHSRFMICNLYPPDIRYITISHYAPDFPRLLAPKKERTTETVGVPLLARGLGVPLESADGCCYENVA